MWPAGQALARGCEMWTTLNKHDDEKGNELEEFESYAVFIQVLAEMLLDGVKRLEVVEGFVGKAYKSVVDLGW